MGNCVAVIVFYDNMICDYLWKHLVTIQKLACWPNSELLITRKNLLKNGKEQFICGHQSYARSRQRRHFVCHELWLKHEMTFYANLSFYRHFRCHHSNTSCCILYVNCNILQQFQNISNIHTMKQATLKDLICLFVFVILL